jgi:hypothetical protein
MLSKCLCGNSYSAATLEEIAKVDLIQVEHRAPFPDSRLIIKIIIIIIINNNNHYYYCYYYFVSRFLLFLFSLS